ncbi:MAG: glycosyltransferase [Bacilli bacterium]|nr:glycosyltransferase [Bacilli bacterium]
MKVLIVFNHPAPYKVRIFNELSKFVDLTVIFERTKAKDRPDIFYNCNDYQFKTIFVKHGYVGNEGSISSAVKKYLKKNAKQFDQIIMNGYSHWSEIKAIKYLNKQKIPYTLLINGGIINKDESSFKRKYKTKIISTASKYMSPSQESTNYLMYYGAKKENIKQYPYSNLSTNDIKKENVDKNLIRRKYSLPENGKIFVNASQFITRKNNLELIKNFEKRKDYLLLIGQGPELSIYENYIKEKNLNNVIIRPFVEKKILFEILSCCDVFVTLALQDIFGHTTLEALANGLPVVSSNKVNSSLEYIKNGVNGYVVDFDNLDNIQEVLDNSLKLKREDAINSCLNNTFESCGKALYEILKK